MSDSLGDGGRLRIDARRWTGQDAVVLLGLAALVALAFYEVVFLGRVFFFRDFGFFFYPKRVLTAEAIRSLAIPHWDSYGGCGSPLLGTLQVAAFYPPALIYYIFPMPHSFMVFVVLHFFISGAGAYYLMRAWGARRIGAAFAAFAWAFSPAFVATVDNVSFQNSLAWLPWCLAFTRRIHQDRGYGSFAWLAVAFAMAMLAGAPEPVIFTALVMAAYAAASFIRTAMSSGFKRAAGPALATAAAVVVGLVLSGVELAPFVHTLMYSARQEGLDVTQAGRWSARPSDVLLWFLPRFYLSADRGGIYWRSQFWLKSVYLGVLVPILAVWTAAVVRRRRNLFFVVVAAVFALLALGSHSFLWTLLYEHLPGFSLIRFPVKFYLPAAFSIAMLAGFAVDDAMVLARMRRRRPLAPLIAALAGIAVLFAALWAVANAWDEDLFRALTPRVLLATADGIEQATEMYDSATWSLGRSAVFLAAGCAALLLALFMARKRMARPYGGFALAMVLFVDLVLFGAHLNPVAGARLYTEPPTHIGLVPTRAGDHRLHMMPDLQRHLSHIRLDRIYDLQGLVNYAAVIKGKTFSSAQEVFDWLEHTSAPRFATLEELDAWLREYKSSQFTADIEYEVAKETLITNINLQYHVPLTDTFEPLSPGRHDRIMSSLKNGDVAAGRDLFLPYMWGASVILSYQEAPPNFAYGPLTPPGRRAVLAENVISASTDEEALATLLHAPIDATRRIVLAAEDADAAARHIGPQAFDAPSAGAPPLGPAHVVRDTGNTLEIEVDASRPAVLFVADCWYPLFEAAVDGAAVPIWRANYAYRAVPVTAGRHIVSFRYRPYDFYVGLVMTSAAAALLIAGAWLSRRRKTVI